jgi:hypothetical protein
VATFGRNNTSTSYTTIEDQLTGSLFSLPVGGTVTNIVADVNCTTAAKNMKCQIYRHSDLVLIAQTDQKSVATGHSQQTFTFSANPHVPAGDYILSAWSAAGSGNGQISYAAGAANQGHYDPAAYGAAPNPMVPTHNNNVYNIYATYTPNLITFTAGAELRYPAFGYTTLGATDIGEITNSTNEYLDGSLFATTENGVGQSITIGLKRNAAGSDNIKCAIYKHSDLSLVGATDQVNTALTTSFAFYNFPFSAKPILVSGTDYILVVWADYTASQIRVCGTGGNVDQEHYQNIAYGAFPDPLVPSHGTYQFSIYCEYRTPINYTNTFTVGAELQTSVTTYTKTFTFNAELQATGLTKGLTINANLLKNWAKTFTASAELIQSSTKGFTVNSNLLKTLTKTLSVNAELLQNATKGFTVNANLLKTQIITFNINTELQQGNVKGFTVNASLTQTLTKTFSLDAELEAAAATFTLGFTVGAQLSSPVSIGGPIGGSRSLKPIQQRKILSPEVMYYLKLYLELKLDVDKIR